LSILISEVDYIKINVIKTPVCELKQWRAAALDFEEDYEC